MDERVNRYYSQSISRLLATGMLIAEIASTIAHDYLDGKPSSKGKKVVTAQDRDHAFWTLPFWEQVPDSAFDSEEFVIALSRYLGQERVNNEALLRRVALRAPTTLQRSVRYAQLFLLPQSPHWLSLRRFASSSGPLAAFFDVCLHLSQQHAQFYDAIRTAQAQLEPLSPLEVLVYASLYAFQQLLPHKAALDSNVSDDDDRYQEVAEVMNDILLWKLRTCPDDAFDLTEQDIAESFRTHLLPFLSQVNRGGIHHDRCFDAFTRLADAHMDLNRFIETVVNPFRFDEDCIMYVRHGTLAMSVSQAPRESAWRRNGRKQQLLQMYWLNRGLDAFVAAGFADTVIGKPENRELNSIAYLKAMRTELQLSELYGLGQDLTVGQGLQVNLFQSLLSMELMSVFFQDAFIEPYLSHLRQAGDWRNALRRLMFGGLMNGMQDRFPLTYSERSEKASKIVPWTRSETHPHGSVKVAEAILEFWTSDLKGLAATLRTHHNAVAPELFERPMLKLGRYLFQLPWLVARQNNSTAAINNLRRLGARRSSLRDETQHIETRLAQLFAERGFAICANYEPPYNSTEDPGEIDLICCRNGVVFVLEIKSSYVRKTMQDAWQHRANTLRKAGRQIERKGAAVARALTTDSDLVARLGIERARDCPRLHCWIVDTSIEHDHEYFSGHLKVSLDEILIALRNERCFLRKLDEMADGQELPRAGGDEPRNSQDTGAEDAVPDAPPHDDLYPDGFSAGRFAEVIETGQVWLRL
jgi:Holliday junction resolvase-like predicted endonuclease